MGLLVFSCAGKNSNNVIFPEQEPMQIDESNPYYLNIEDANYDTERDYIEDEPMLFEEISEQEEAAAFIEIEGDADSILLDYSEDIEPEEGELSLAYISCMTPGESAGLGGVAFDQDLGCICGYEADGTPLYLSQSNTDGCSISAH